MANHMQVTRDIQVVRVIGYICYKSSCWYNALTVNTQFSMQACKFEDLSHGQESDGFCDGIKFVKSRFVSLIAINTLTR